MKIKGRKIFANSFSSTGQKMRKRERKRERDKQVSGNISFSNSGFLVGKLERERERERKPVNALMGQQFDIILQQPSNRLLKWQLVYMFQYF